MQQGGQGYSPLADALGSLRQWTNAAGAVVGSASYDPFGGVLSQQGFTSPWGFAGEYHDPATGLQYLRARWYQPGVGRFTQGDPFPGVLALPLTLNPYVYAVNNPVRYTDPSGRFPFLLLGAVALYAAGAAAYYHWVPDVQQGFQPAHLLGYFMGYENIRQDWKTLVNPCTSGLAKVWAVADATLNVTLGIAMVYGALNAFRAVYAAEQLTRTGVYGSAILEWGDDFFRPLGSNVIRAPQLPTSGLGGVWNRLRLLGGIAHEYAHFQQEFFVIKQVATFVTKPLQQLSVLLQPARNVEELPRMLLLPFYLLNPVEVHAAASGGISFSNLALLLESRGVGFATTFAPEWVPSVINSVKKFFRGQ